MRVRNEGLFVYIATVKMHDVLTREAFFPNGWEVTPCLQTFFSATDVAAWQEAAAAMANSN